MVLPFLVPLLGMVGAGVGVGAGAGIFSRLKRRETPTEEITGTIKTVAIIGGLVIGVTILAKTFK